MANQNNAEREQRTPLQRLLDNCAEVIMETELAELIETKPNRSAYIGFEPSGRVHIGWMIIINKLHDLLETGFELTVLLADWHAYINDKYGGDIDAIQACGRYMIDCFTALGLPQEHLEYVFASRLIDSKDYWEKVLRVAKQSTLHRTKRAMTIMGRKEDEGDIDTSKFFYPAMQVADIFELGVDVAFGGLDQRKAHMLARDVAEKLNWPKPIAIHTPLLAGLDMNGRMDPEEAKMSKSKPDSCIYIHDSPKDVTRKINGAFCPEGELDPNPVIDICKLIIFPQLLRASEPFTVKRPEKWGGNLNFDSYHDLETQFSKKALHPMDLKQAVSRYLNQILDPVRDYFSAHPENLNIIEQYGITR